MNVESELPENCVREARDRSPGPRKPSLISTLSSSSIAMPGLNPRASEGVSQRRLLLGHRDPPEGHDQRKHDRQKVMTRVRRNG
jgi:hypothetical protein